MHTGFSKRKTAWEISLSRGGSEGWVRDGTYDEAKAACGGELPAFIAPDMTPRIVTIVPDTPGCPCGGTHVARMSEIQDFKMTGVRVKKGVTRLSYAIPGMATW